MDRNSTESTVPSPLRKRLSAMPYAFASRSSRVDSIVTTSAQPRASAADVASQDIVFEVVPGQLPEDGGAGGNDDPPVHEQLELFIFGASLALRIEKGEEGSMVGDDNQEEREVIGRCLR